MCTVDNLYKFYYMNNQLSKQFMINLYICCSGTSHPSTSGEKTEDSKKEEQFPKEERQHPGMKTKDLLTPYSLPEQARLSHLY